MKKPPQIHILGYLAFCYLAAVVSTTASARTLGLKFAATDPDAATSSLAASDVAGVVPAANWNNLPGATGTGGSLFQDNAGVASASAVTVTWSSPNTWRSTTGNNAFPAGPNRVLMAGYLDTNNTAAGGISIAVTGIDAAIRTPRYDVYVYLLGDSGDTTRGGGYTINDGIQTIVKYGSTLAMPTAFVEDPGTDPDNTIDGNYLRFRNLTGSSFTLTSDTTLSMPNNGFRAPINAVQIVTVPEPVSAALVCCGAMLHAMIRRRSKR